MSNLENWIKAILKEDADNLSISSVRRLQIIKYGVQKLQKEVDEKDNFAISFACWLKSPEGQMYEASGMTAQALLDKYKDRPFINTFDIEQQ